MAREGLVRAKRALERLLPELPGCGIYIYVVVLLCIYVARGPASWCSFADYHFVSEMGFVVAPISLCCGRGYSSL